MQLEPGAPGVYQHRVVIEPGQSGSEACPSGQAAPTPLISVVILNYNGARWIERCLDSLKAQTLFGEIEVIVADNLSTDGSDRLSERLLSDWSNGRFIQNGANLGFCEGNNRPARSARGEYLFFLNNDTWLEPDCLEVLLREVRAAQAEVGMPLILNYEDNSVQTYGGAGYDCFGCLSIASSHQNTQEAFVASGCAYFIRRDCFQRVGEFDAALFMYADEYDLSWRTWVAGARTVVVPAARLHHRWAANVNPEGGGRIVEYRTSDSKRFYANRNNLLVLCKSCQHILLGLVAMHLGLLAAEFCVSLILIRRWSHLRKAYLAAVADCWRLRYHILAERRRLKAIRRRSDWWMLRFLKWRLNRYEEFRRVWQMGLPRIDAR